MKKLTLIPCIALAALIIVSCKKENVETTTNPTGNAAQLSNFLSSNLENSRQNFTINASSGGVIIGSKGTRVNIQPNVLLNGNNQVVSGNVTVELVEIYDRASMLFLNKPTMGVLPNGKHAALISGGEYYLKITQNGALLHSDNGVNVLLPASNTGGLQNGMNLFNGVFNDQQNLEWNLLTDTVNVVQDTTGTGGGTFTTSYSILDGNWGWTNVDRFYSDPRPKTTLKVKVTTGFDETNCEVYMTYDGEPTALASLDHYTSDGFFSEHYGQIPIGLNVHFIAVTIIDGQLNYAIHAATITDNYIEYINSFTPISQTDLATLINNLP
jgi:hypothetical protein